MKEYKSEEKSYHLPDVLFMNMGLKGLGEVGQVGPEVAVRVGGRHDLPPAIQQVVNRSRRKQKSTF